MEKKYIWRDTNRVALILGGSGSLGSEIARRFAKVGYPLILAARDYNKLENTKQKLLKEVKSNLKIDCLSFDFTDKKSIFNMVQKIKNKKLRLSIVINTAAGFYRGNFEDMSLDELDNLIDSNYKGMVLLIHQLLPILRVNAPSDIVNITSISSATTLNTSRSSSAHIATKAALHIFDTVLSREVVNQGIRITTVAPSTFAKEGKEGIPLDVLANLILQVVEWPPIIRVETLVVSSTGWK